MDNSLSLARYFARLVWLLVHEGQSVREQKAALRAAITVSKDASVRLGTREGRLAVNGLVMPQAFAASLQPFPERAGAASSLGGVIQQSAAAITGAAVGHAISTTAWPLVLPMAAAGLLTLAVWLFTRSLRGAG